MTRYEKLDEMLQALAKKAGAEWYAIIEEGQEEFIRDIRAIGFARG